MNFTVLHMNIMVKRHRDALAYLYVINVIINIYLLTPEKVRLCPYVGS